MIGTGFALFGLSYVLTLGIGLSLNNRYRGYNAIPVVGPPIAHAKSLTSCRSGSFVGCLGEELSAGLAALSVTSQLTGLVIGSIGAAVYARRHRRRKG